MRLIDADALNDYVMDTWSGGNIDNTAIWYGDVFKAIHDAPTIDAVPVMHDKWISIKDRLPQADGSYLICTNRGAVCTSHYYTGANYFSAPSGKNAIYWMPLPEPPKEEKYYKTTVWNSFVEINIAPTIDAVPVVRCKDCKHAEKSKYAFDWDGKTPLCECSYMTQPNRWHEYCSWAERKEAE